MEAPTEGRQTFTYDYCFAHNPIVPHTVVRQSRTCESCHGNCGLTAAMAGMCYGAYQVPCPDPSVIPALGGSPPPSGNPNLLGGRK